MSSLKKSVRKPLSLTKGSLKCLRVTMRFGVETPISSTLVVLLLLRGFAPNSIRVSVAVWLMFVFIGVPLLERFVGVCEINFDLTSLFLVLVKQSCLFVWVIRHAPIFKFVSDLTAKMRGILGRQPQRDCRPAHAVLLCGDCHPECVVVVIRVNKHSFTSSLSVTQCVTCASVSSGAFDVDACFAQGNVHGAAPQESSRPRSHSHSRTATPSQECNHGTRQELDTTRRQLSHAKSDEQQSRGVRC